MMPSNFDEQTTEIEAFKVGEESEILNVSLVQIDRPIIVVQEGERYRNGEPLEEAKINTSEDEVVPPSFSCPISPNILESFGVSLVNNRVLVSYVINVPSGSSVKIVVSRLDLGAERFEIISERTQSDDDVFYDQDVFSSFNTEYIYQLTADLVTIDELGNEVVCTARSLNGNASKLRASTPVNSDFPRLATFVGEYLDRHRISYTWYPLDNIPIDEYRLSVLKNGQYEVVEVISTSVNQANGYVYEHGDEVRGESVRMKIQYRAAGGAWLGDFYDETHASFRQPNWPFRYYGIIMNPDVFQAYEIGESPLFGFPEIRIVIARANTSTSESEPNIREAYVFTTNSCIFDLALSREVGDPLAWSFYRECAASEQSTYYVPTDSRFGHPLIPQWDGGLIGSNLNIVSTESDDHDIRVVDRTLTEGRETNIKGDFGFKASIPMIGDASTSVGVSTKWSNTSVVRLIYPGDLSVNTFNVRYHHPLRVDLGNEVYGYGVAVGERSEMFGDQYLDYLFFEYSNVMMLRPE